MSSNRAHWVENSSTVNCTQCETETVESLKRNCRKCGQIFCHACTESRCLIPSDELVARPVHIRSYNAGQDDDFRNPQHVCDECFYTLADIQAELVEALSRRDEKAQIAVQGPNNLTPVSNFVNMAVRQASVKVVTDISNRVTEASTDAVASPITKASPTDANKPSPAAANPILNFVSNSVLQAQLSVSSLSNAKPTIITELSAEETGINGKDSYTSVGYESDDFEPVGEQSAVLEQQPVMMMASVVEYATDFEEDTFEPADVLERDSLTDLNTAMLGNTAEGTVNGSLQLTRSDVVLVAENVFVGESPSVLSAALPEPHVHNSTTHAAMDAELDEYMQPYLDNESQQSVGGNNMSIDSLPVYNLPPSGTAPHAEHPEGIAAGGSEKSFSSHQSNVQQREEERAGDDAHIETATEVATSVTVSESAPVGTPISSPPFASGLISCFIQSAVSQASAKVATVAATTTTPTAPALVAPVETTTSPLRACESPNNAAARDDASPVALGDASPRATSEPTEPSIEPSSQPATQSESEPVRQPVNQPVNIIHNFVSSAMLQAQVTVSAKYASPAKQRPAAEIAKETVVVPAITVGESEGFEGTSSAKEEPTELAQTEPAARTEPLQVTGALERNSHEEEEEAPEAESELVKQEAPSGPMVWDEDLDCLVTHAEYAAKSSIIASAASGSGKDTSKVAQLRSAVSEHRESAAPVVKKTKKQLEEEDRTFLTSIQYVPPANRTQAVNTNPYGTRPGTATSSSAKAATITKRDLLRARSAGASRPGTAAGAQRSRSPHRRKSPPKSPPKSPKRGSSPYRAEPYPVPRPAHSAPPAVDKRKLFVPPPLLLPSKTLPKELSDYLFASEQESELKMSLFCQHGRHFAVCKAELCIDAHEKYRWLNLIHQKAKLACELVCDADRMWRKKLEDSLAAEVEEKKELLEQELLELNENLKKRNNAAVRLLKQGVRFYESVQPAMHRGEISAEELHAGTGWTEEHYENFKRRLKQEQERADFRRKKMLDQQAHKNQEVIDNLKNSLSSPMMYLDGMLKSRLEKIHGAVRKIDLCFQYSIKLAVGNGKGKSEEELKAEARARSPMKNAVMAERLARNSQHGFDILKASLGIVADVCSDVRLMYRGIKRGHSLKQEKRDTEASEGRSRSPSPARQPRPKTPQAATRPHSAPSSSASPVRKGKPKKRSARSARGPRDHSAGRNGRVSPQGSHVSYAADFENSAEVADDTYEDDDVSDMMKEMLDEAGNRRVSTSSLRQGSGSVAEDIMDVAADAPHQRPGTSKVAAKPRALSRSSSNNNNEVDEVASESDGFPGEANYEVNVGNMYDDDFAEDSVILSKAFGEQADLGKVKTGSEKAKIKQKKRSKKVSKLIHSDNLLKPLANMKPTQRNQQSVLHGLLLSNNIPLHYSEEDHVVGTKVRPPRIVVTDSWDRPISIKITTKTPPLVASASSPKIGKPTNKSHSVSAPAGILKSSGQAATGAQGTAADHGVLIQCYLCRKRIAPSLAKHIPVPNAASDAAVMERARMHQKATGQLFPTFNRLQVTSSTGAQQDWIRQQQELHLQLIGAPHDGSPHGTTHKSSVTMQKYEFPFCSWECVKSYALSTCTLQQKYQTDILIDIAAGYTVQAAAATASVTK